MTGDDETLTLRDYAAHLPGCASLPCEGHYDGTVCTNECPKGFQPCTCGLDALLSSAPAPAPAVALAVRAFYDRVNARAEAEILSGKPVTGAHHRALEVEIALLPSPPEAAR